jgi:DNA-binding CsgD family transcriptional regulator
LHVSVKTVEVHRANIKRKLNLKTATDLVRQAVRWADSEGSH